MLARYIHPFRYLSVVVVVCSFLGSLLMFFIGLFKTYRAFAVCFRLIAVPDELESVKLTDLAIGSVIGSMDAFLVGLALMIFGYGVFTLFIREISPNEAGAFRWINIPSLGHLKSLLAEIVIVIIFVKFLEVVVISINKLSWEVLILPASILLLALGLKFMDLRN